MESSRVGRVGNNEVHLKTKMQITSEMVSQIATLPSEESFYVAVKNTNTGEWSYERSFDNFPDADSRFVTLCKNKGLDKADRFNAGKHDGRGRVIE